VLRLGALLLTVLTGLSGLVYEVAWEKYLATLLGSHSEASAAVLGIFLGGMSLGYKLWGSLTRRWCAASAESAAARLLAGYGMVEAAIGVYALAFPLLFRGARALSTALPHGSGGAGFALDVGLAALLIGPPSVLLGGTIPFLTQALARGLADATRFHALVYAFNTAGAFAGALAAGYWWLPTLGLVGSLRAMALVNLGAGAAFALMALGARGRAAAAPPAPAPPPARVPGFARLATAALLVGFAMMTVQTVLIRLGGLALGASQFTFSLVVAVFVLCIALGSLGVSALGRIPRGLLAADLWALLALLLALYPQLQNGPYWAHALRSLFRSDAAAFYPFQLATLLGVLAVIGPAVVLSGAALPLIFDQLRREVRDLGDVAGALYSANTLGSLFGALLGGYALFFWLDLHQVYRVALAALALAAVLATRPLLGLGRVAAAGVLALALASIALLPPWSPERLAAGLLYERTPGPESFAGPERFFASRRPASLVFYEDGPTTSVAVSRYESKAGVDLSLMTNGKREGSVRGDYLTTALIALLPALFAERAERAFVIGYGTGVTPGELARLPSMREVSVAEIARSVLRAAPLLDEANGRTSTQPALRILEGDAYRTLLRSAGGYDVIASEPSHTWALGIDMLYSREFLEGARDRLASGGVFCQWMHAYALDDATLALVLRTYTAVFEHVSVWYGLDNDLLLLGFRDETRALDVERLEARAGEPDFRAALLRAGIRSFPQLLAHELLPLGVAHASLGPGEVQTLLHPQLGYLAARAFFHADESRLPSTATLEGARLGRSHSLVRRFARRFGGALPERERGAFVGEACRHLPRECAVLLAQWTHEVPDSRPRERVLKAVRERRKVSALARAIPLHDVDRLAALFDPLPSTPADGAHALAEARQATELFWNYYHHAAPFPRERIAALWRRCEGSGAPRAACRDGRMRTEQLIGRLDAAPDPKES